MIFSICKGGIKKMVNNTDNLQSIRDLLNQGYSIYGEINDNVKRLEELKEEIKETGDNFFILNSFEVHERTKKHNTHYVTVCLDGELVSGYASALGSKLMKIAKTYGETDLETKHYYMKDGLDISIELNVSESENGEYLDIKAI